MSRKQTRQPVIIDLDPADAPASLTPSEAPPVPEPIGESRVTALETAVVLGARKRSFLGRLFIGGLAALISFALSVALWDFVANMLARNLWLGRTALALLALVVLALVLLCLRELASLFRLARVDGLRKQADAALQGGTLDQAQHFQRRLVALYRGRADLQWAFADLGESGELMDPDAVLHLTENTLLGPLDKAALGEIEAAARRVATVTALVPLALADVIVALTANLRMIRRIAEIYGGRSGFFGSWRLTRAVAAHLVATGAVAIGDDMIGSLAGGGVLSKLSRRFGEGLINGALTARVGIAAMDVCRPMPFAAQPRPKVSAVVRKALTGLFG